VFSSAAAFGDTVIAVYRASDGAALGCNAGTTATLPLRVAAGDYLVQVGTKGSDVAGLGTGPMTIAANLAVDPDVDNDGDLASTDCDDRNPAIRHGIVDIPDDGIDQDCDAVDAVDLDRDRDGETRPADCNDANPAIRHGAGDIPGNALDEDCSGSPAPFPRVESTVRASWRFSPFRISKLAIVRAVPGSRVEIRCRGGGCPFKRETITIRRAAGEQSILGRKLKRARLKRKAILEVRITMNGHVGFMRRLTVKTASRDPELAEFCLPPGAAATRC
jgi:hypothetical protein